MIQSRWSKVLGCLPLVGALAVFSGCQNQGTGTQAVESESDNDTAVATSKLEEAQAPAKDLTKAGARHGKHGGGPERLLYAAMHTLDLSDAQKQTIQAQIDALHAAKAADGDKADFAAHRTAIAAQIRSGKIDQAALQLPAGMKGMHDHTGVAKALQTLHDTLTAPQRQQLVDSINARAEEREEHFAEKGDHQAGGPVAHMLKDMNLSDAQRAKVDAALASLAPAEADREAMKTRHEAMKKEMTARLATFSSESFDAAAMVALPKDAPAPDHAMGPAMMGKALAAVLPILDATQREDLAKRFEAGPKALSAGGEGKDCQGK